MAKRIISKRVCSGCIEEFDPKELSVVSIKDKYTTIFCDKCIKKQIFSKENIIRALVKPRKKRETKNKK